MKTRGIDQGSNPDPDLLWGLERLQDRDLAVRLVRLLESRLCIHSASTHRLYSQYALHVPGRDAVQMVVQPDTRDITGTFHHVSTQALRRTGLCLLPGQFDNREGLLLARLGGDGEPQHVQPLKSALALIVSRLGQRGERFLPLLIKGDLDEYRGMPYLHLHRLQPDALQLLSPFERHALQQVITDRLQALFRDADRLVC